MATIVTISKSVGANRIVPTVAIPLGAIALILYVLIGWKFDNFREEVNAGAKGLKVPAFFKPIAYLLPIALIIIFVTGLGIF